MFSRLRLHGAEPAPVPVPVASQDDMPPRPQRQGQALYQWRGPAGAFSTEGLNAEFDPCGAGPITSNGEDE